MGTNRSNKAPLEVIPPRICITFRRASFWFRPKTSKMQIWKHPGRKHDKYGVLKVGQPFWKWYKSWNSFGTEPIFDFSGWESSILTLNDATNPMGALLNPKTAIQNSKSIKIQLTPLGTVYTKLFRQPFVTVSPHAIENSACGWAMISIKLRLVVMQ